VVPAPGTAHSLGQHVVGQRVVVRRVVRGETGPSGGPALTDVLGTLESWDDEWCVVRRETGEPVSIAVADIVTGKPVPPRASVRQRVSAREAEILALPLWTSPTTYPLGDWVLRLVEGERGRASRRANSCLAIGDPGSSLEQAAGRVREFYLSHGRDVLVQTEAASAVETGLVALGWRVLEPLDSPYLVGSVVMAHRAAGPADGVETVIDGTRLLATLTVDGEEVGRVRGELNSDWLWVHGLTVDASWRRQGVGRRLMAGLLEAAAETGAATVWLEVDRDNTPAWMLYAVLGLREHHLCHYLQAPAD
jgi:ribosomal protein S18 acetylase RimI-like enzyme